MKSGKEEIRSLEFWRAIIAECLATFFYVFLVCATHISWTGSVVGHHTQWAVMSFTSGFAMATLTECFGHISGAHCNPAVTCALFITQKITFLRTALYIVSQCGGSIAGAALLYGVSVPGHQGALGISVAHDALGPWQIFCVEFVLTFLVVFTIFASLDPTRKSLASSSLSIGIGYLVCSLSGIPASGASLNPARTLGPSFVMNRWKHHWVYWLGPGIGGIMAGLIYEFIFDTQKCNKICGEGQSGKTKSSLAHPPLVPSVLWAQHQGPIFEESESDSFSPYASLPFQKTVNMRPQPPPPPLHPPTPHPENRRPSQHNMGCKAEVHAQPNLRTEVQYHSKKTLYDLNMFNPNHYLPY